MILTQCPPKAHLMDSAISSLITRCPYLMYLVLVILSHMNVPSAARAGPPTG